MARKGKGGLLRQRLTRASHLGRDLNRLRTVGGRVPFVRPDDIPLVLSHARKLVKDIQTFIDLCLKLVERVANEGCPHHGSGLIPDNIPFHLKCSHPKCNFTITTKEVAKWKAMLEKVQRASVIAEIDAGDTV